jgi:hypothetical protein
MPAKAGIQKNWVPAFAGTTDIGLFPYRLAPLFGVDLGP